MMAVISFIAANWEVLLAGVVALITAAVAIALVVPGDQPDKTLQAILDFITKFSRKPKE